VTLLLVRKINPKLERIVASFANLQNQSPIDTMAGKNQRIIIIKKKGVDGEEEGGGKGGQKRRHGQGCRRWRRLGLGFAKGMKCLSLTPFALRRHLLLYIYIYINKNNTTIFGSLSYYSMVNNKLLFL
jgi:hypothetical protein